MATTTFDTLGYFEKLKAAGVSEAQAKVQADTMRDFVLTQDEATRKELPTKGDLQVAIKELELRLLKWQLGIGLTLALIMAKGFGWLGF